MESKRRTQTERSAATRGALVAAARRLWSERGYADVGTPEIAAAAGVTRGAMYHQFADKAALFLAVAEAVETDVTARLGEYVVASGAADPAAALHAAVDGWLEACEEPEVRQVLCFENKGDIVGVSNPHPHGQIYATSFAFKTFEIELGASERHQRETGRGLMADIIHAEQQDGRRVLHEDEHVIAFVPYFARYAYEVYVVPKRRVAHVYELTDAEVTSLAGALSAVTVRFDNLWRMSFPYVQVLHQAPSDERDTSAFHFFIAFHPPLRQPHLLKYLAGPEIGGGNFVSDTSPEAKAAELRALSPLHYKRA